MALVKCRACGGEVPDQARSCTHCRIHWPTKETETVHCRKCGEKIADNCIMCPHCDAPDPASYYDDAVMELEAVLSGDPDNAQIHYEIGKLYANKLKNATKANIHLKRAIDLKPDHPQVDNISNWLAHNKTN
jgi:hypothetical protein